MSFMKRAQEAAAQVAAMADKTANDPATQEQLSRSAREAMGMARRGVTTVIEKIDPSTLAELIVRATALQEMTNRSLREKGSPYRIAEISISASIPPAVSFSIGRLGDDELVGEVHSSAELVEQADDAGELVLALDGTTVDDAAVTSAGGAGRRQRDAADGRDCPRAARRRAPLRPRTPRPASARRRRAGGSNARPWLVP